MPRDRNTRRFFLAGLLTLATVAVPARGQPFERDSGAFAGFSRGNGVAVADYDGDGDLDVYLVAYPQYDPADSLTWNRLYRNDGDRFVDVTESAGVASRVTGMPRGQMGNKFGAAWGDYDGDGDPDLFLAQIGPDLLFRNEGDGTFADVTDAAGVAGAEPADHHSSALWWDPDRDGDLDLYVSAWVGDNVFYENRGDGTFIDRTADSGLGDSGQTWTSIPLDADGDGLPDLYVVNDFGANRFYRNRGDGTFEEATAVFGLEDPGHGMGVTVGDVNNDGLFDIYLTNDTDHFLNPLFMAEPGGPFVEQAEALGVSDADWGWGTAFLDYDCDGDLDLYAVNGFPIDPGHNYLFTNRLADTGTLAFRDDSATSGADGLPDARGLAVFDADGDGHLDLLVANWDQPPDLYRNRTVDGHWLMVDLVASPGEGTPFGAVAHVYAAGMELHRAFDGVSFLGQSIAPFHFGLGMAERVDSLVIEWPRGGREVFTDLAVDRRMTVRPGDALLTGVDTPAWPNASFRLLGAVPDPVVGDGEIRFVTDRPTPYRVRVYDLLGRRRYEASGVASGPGGVRVPAAALPAGGVYFYRIDAGGRPHTGSFVVIR